jgi:arsenate reductase-like glutaredoxin family protein
MLPVLFYSLIAQHESNERSVARRNNKLQEAKANKQPELEWKMPDLFKDFAPEYYLDLKKEESFEKVFRTQEKLIKKCNYYDNPFISAELKQTTALCQNLFGHLHYFDYFEDIGDIDAIIEEEVEKRPDLCDALVESHNSEVETILSNPMLVSMLEPEAEKLGITVEEYVVKLNQMIKEHPKEFAELIDAKLRNRHKKESHEE